MECPFPNFNDGIVEFGNGYVISSHTLQGMWLLIHTGIKVNLYQSNWDTDIAAENAKSWFAQRTTHGWWLRGPSQFCVVRESKICSEHEIN